MTTRNPYELDGLPEELVALADTIRTFLATLPVDDEVRANTPNRFVKALYDCLEGYRQDVTDHLKLFPDDDVDHGNGEVVIVNVPFYSLCEHHLLPFFGTMTVAYVPSDHVLGLSKLNRIVHTYARRLQLQERLTEQVVTTLLSPPVNARGALAVSRARHMCVEMRGVRQVTTTTVVHYGGCLRPDTEWWKSVAPLVERETKSIPPLDV